MKQVLVETRLFTAMPISLSENNVSERGLPLVEGILATAEVKNGNGSDIIFLCRGSCYCTHVSNG